MKAWHFTDGNRLRDGSPLPAIGETLRHKGELIICQSGLHASKRLIDALQYAPGNLLHRVEISGAEAQEHGDKVVARDRTILWSVNVEPILKDFARRCALDVAHLWDAPKVVVRYLKTGDACFRNAALAAARSAVRATTTWEPARDAARAAALVLRAAARSAAWDTAQIAAWDTAQIAAQVAAWDAPRDADQDAVWDAVWAAAREKQNRRLTSMVVAACKVKG